MTGRLSKLNTGLRAVMEFGIVLSTGYWGFRTGGGTLAKIVLGIGAPLLVFGFWGLVDFRGAGSLAESLRLIQELVITALAAVALYLSGQTTLAWAMALISIIHHALVYSLGESLLKKTPA